MRQRRSFSGAVSPCFRGRLPVSAGLLCWASWTVCACFARLLRSLYFMLSGDSFPSRLFPFLLSSFRLSSFLCSTITRYYIEYIYIYYIRARVSAFPPFYVRRGWMRGAGARAVPLFMYAGGFSRLYGAFACFGPVLASWTGAGLV